MKYILYILWYTHIGFGGVATSTTIEFNSMETCTAAKYEIINRDNFKDHSYTVACLEK